VTSCGIDNCTLLAITADVRASYQRIRPKLCPRHDPELGVH